MKVRGVGSVGRSGGGGKSLAPGQLVHGRVLASTGEGRFKVSVNGLLLEADSDLPLEAGQRLLARVEVAGQKVLLRVQDDSGWKPPWPDNPATEEIRRVLEGLGLTPDTFDVMEFQERLARYRPHGSLTGVDPSDVWVLAILWARGVRGESDAFALSSFYLRCLCLDYNASNLNLPSEAALVSALGLPELAPTGEDSQNPNEESSDLSGSLVPGLEDRTRESLELLNRESITHGMYRIGESVHILTQQQEEPQLSRLTDNPVKPGYVLEIRRSGEAIAATLHLPPGPALQQIAVNIWHLNWKKMLASAQIEALSFSTQEAVDREELRFAFWRTWPSENDHIRQA